MPWARPEFIINFTIFCGIVAMAYGINALNSNGNNTINALTTKTANQMQ